MLEWVEAWEFSHCDATRGKRSRVKCEMPQGHGGSHTGRGRAGQWFILGERWR